MVKGWGKTDLQETLDQYEEDMSGGADFFKFKDGDNEVRLCPPAEDETRPYAKRGQHWRIGDAEKVFNCPRAVNEDALCFLCDKQKELKKSDDDADQDKAEDMYAKRQFLYRVIDPSEAGLRKGIQVMGVGIKTHKQIAKLLRDKEYGPVIFNPERGLNIKIEKSGSGKNGTEYVVRPCRTETDVVAILEANEPPDIFELCKVATNKQMTAAWNGEVTEAGEKPKAETSRRRDVVDAEEPVSRRARANDPDDEPGAASDASQAALSEDGDGPEEDEDDAALAAAEAALEEARARKAAKAAPRSGNTAGLTPKRAAPRRVAAEPEEPTRGRRIASRSRDED
jgi:gp32 DNA binding protein like